MQLLPSAMFFRCQAPNVTKYWVRKISAGGGDGKMKAVASHVERCQGVGAEGVNVWKSKVDSGAVGNCSTLGVIGARDIVRL